MRWISTPFGTFLEVSDTPHAREFMGRGSVLHDGMLYLSETEAADYLRGYGWVASELEEVVVNEQLEVALTSF